MTIITGQERVRMASRLALRKSLQFKITHGMYLHRGRVPSAILSDDAEFCTWAAENGTTAMPRDLRKQYDLLNRFIVDRLGPEFDSPGA